MLLSLLDWVLDLKILRMVVLWSIITLSHVWWSRWSPKTTLMKYWWSLRNWILVSLMIHSPFCDGVLRYQGRLCVPNIDCLRNRILDEGHRPVTPFIRVRQTCTMKLGKCFDGEVWKRTWRNLFLSVQIANKWKPNIKSWVVYYKRSKVLLGSRKTKIWIFQ